MTSDEKAPPARFDISAAVVFRLGNELITDVVQALVELVKNSYDADATWVNVTIDTKGKNRWGRRYRKAIGGIHVEDNGDGMDEAAIHRGWLTIANSPKREQKSEGKTTRLGRTPIGDKGLGRLSSQRLASNVEVVTQPPSQPPTEHYIAFSWDDFRDASNLGDVPVHVEQTEGQGGRKGTRLVLSGLLEPETWQDKKQLQTLHRNLSGMISPFEETRDFRVRLEVDGNALELADIPKRVRETALLKYEFEFDGESFSIFGFAQLKYLTPSGNDEQELFDKLCTEGREDELYGFLASKMRGSRPPHFVRSERKKWFVEFGTKRKLEDFDDVRRINDSVAQPGPFRGEVDSVSLDSSDFNEEGFDANKKAIRQQSEYRKLVRELAGIRVYRDGFGIRVGEDWLGLGKQWTGGTSYYGLRPRNVLGYVSISAQDNPDLVETTSREGFQITPHYENFFSLMTEFVKFAADSQGFLRRGVLAFLREYRDSLAGFTSEDDHPQVTQRIDEIASNLSDQKIKVEQQAGSLRDAAVGAAKTLTEVRNTIDETVADGAQVSRALKELEDEIDGVSTAVVKEEKLLGEVSAALAQASDLKSTREVLDRRWDSLNEQVAALYESISLGLTAEALAHEIHNIADRLARRSSVLLREVRDGVRKSSMVTYIEEVRSSVGTMRKQLGHLTPSLRYLRERRDRIELSSFVEELAEFYEERFTAKGMKILSEVRSPGFVVNMNKGKLTQVFDNLILNAEYWLKEAIRTRRVPNGVITIAVGASYVRVWDNGRGIEESVEDTLFEPFVTTKRRGEGRGLGLYVSRQLLDSEACELVLLPQRNSRGRRYVFELNLSGAISE